QIAGWASLLVFLVRFQAWMFLGRLNRIACGVLLAALSLFQVRLVALDVIDVLGDAHELALLRVGITQHFDALAVQGGEQRAATAEPVGAGRLDLFQTKFYARREPVAV